MASVELAVEAAKKRLQPHEQQKAFRHHQHQKNLEHGTKYLP
jgi:hypothetical protein